MKLHLQTLAGIYFHIPFCKQACFYCDFHFSTNFRNVETLVLALHTELKLQQEYVRGDTVHTIYFGGGTPSSIHPKHIGTILDKVLQWYSVAEDTEITLEVNPDDLTKTNLHEWKSMGVNRLSVGVQSFTDTYLQFMNRAHNSSQARHGLRIAREVGFSNTTIDLIYGIPKMTLHEWENNLITFLSLDLPHLSAYGLTIEPKTHLGHLLRSKKLYVEKDEAYKNQFELMMDVLGSKGFEHYEISNFAKPGMYSRHNTAYWTGGKYLGIGPSAHSYNGRTRHWNVSSNRKYIQALLLNELPQESETLSTTDQFNEYILTRLRTQWGIDLYQIKKQFGSAFQNIVQIRLKPYIASGHIIFTGKTFVLTRAGKHIADKIASDLFEIA